MRSCALQLGKERKVAHRLGVDEASCQWANPRRLSPVLLEFVSCSTASSQPGRRLYRRDWHCHDRSGIPAEF